MCTALVASGRTKKELRARRDAHGAPTLVAPPSYGDHRPTPAVSVPQKRPPFRSTVLAYRRRPIRMSSIDAGMSPTLTSV